jgi:hypothetical protein
LRVENQKIGNLDQGTIFSCAYAERYSERPVCGIVITARCDFAQDKFPLVNYVPLVTFNDWIKRDGFDLVKDRCKKQVNGDIRKLFKEWNIVESVLLANDVSIVVQDYVSHSDSKNHKRLALSGEKVVNAWLTSSQVNYGDIATLGRAFPSIVDGVVRELATHRLSGHYFLPLTKADGADEYHVALLREASFLPRDLALELSNGLQRDSPSFAKNLDWLRWIRFSGAEEMAMPICQVPSPEIEHLLQSFSMLFGRIGISDVPIEQIEKVCQLARDGQ